MVAENDATLLLLYIQQHGLYIFFTQSDIVHMYYTLSLFIMLVFAPIKMIRTAISTVDYIVKIPKFPSLK